MKPTTRLVTLAGSALSLGLLAIAFGQDSDTELPASDTESTVEERLLELERRVATLDTQLQLRTTAGAGPEDRINRDFNLDTRLNDIERRLEQLDNELTTLQRQTSEAARMAGQAQREAQMAQQLARDLSNRVR